MNATLSAAQLEQIAEAATDKVVTRILELLQQYQTKATNVATENWIKELLQQYDMKLVDEVAKKVTNILLTRAPDDLPFQGDNAWTTPPCATKDAAVDTPELGGSRKHLAKLHEPVVEENLLAVDGVEHPLGEGLTGEGVGYQFGKVR